MADEEQSLTWRLSDEGMDLLERAGLAALYITLKAASETGTDLSPLRWSDDDLTEDSVTVRWTGPAKPAFVKLMEWAWQVHNGILYFPAIHGERELAQWWLRVPSHNGIMRTFLQHTNVQPKGEPVTQIVKLDENREIAVSFQPPIVRVPKIKADSEKQDNTAKKLLKPHKDVMELFDRRGGFHTKDVELSNWVYPGIAGRYTNEEAWSGDARRAALLMLAPTACLYQRLSGAGGNWVFVCPDVRSLDEFNIIRKRLSLDPEFTDVASLGDAALQFLAEYSTRLPRKSLRVGCSVIAMGKVGYYASQSIRKAILSLGAESKSIKRYRLLHNALPNNYIARKIEAADKTGKRPSKKSTKGKNPAKTPDGPKAAGFIKLPTGRGRIADNLIEKRAWYSDLMIPMPWDLDGLEHQRQSGESLERLFFRNICYQRSTLMKLIQDDEMWDSEAEMFFVRAFWETLDSLYAQEAEAIKRGGSRTLSDRFEDLNEDIRRRLMQAKTRVLLRSALADLFSRAGRQKTIRLHPAVVWRLIDDPKQWQKGRDLALLALASHRKKEDRENNNTLANLAGV